MYRFKAILFKYEWEFVSLDKHMCFNGEVMFSHDKHGDNFVW